MDGAESVLRLLPTMRLAIRASCLLFIFSVAACVVACGRIHDATTVAGIYEAVYSFGTERLELHGNGTYDQVLKLTKTGNSISHNGRWEFDGKQQLVRVLSPLQFDDNLGKLNPTYAKPVDGSWDLDARQRFGTIVLSWNDDVGVELKRVQ